jgi:hypothetical protein
MPILDCFTDEQKLALVKYENLSGFEPMHQDEFAAGEMSFEELWRSNQHWFHSLQNEVSNINAPVGIVDDDGFDLIHFIDHIERA